VATANIPPAEAVTSIETGRPPGKAPDHSAKSGTRRKWLLGCAAGVGVCGAAYFLSPWLCLAWTTVSTDDAYVNGYVTFVAARERGEELAPKGTISKEEFDQRKEALKVAAAAVEQALQQAYAIRVGLGLPAVPPDNKELTDAPADLDQNFSTVRQAVAELMQSAAQIGYYFPVSRNATPKELVAAFHKQDPKGDVDRICERLLETAPIVKQAQAKLLQAGRDLEQAELNLRYTDVVSEIDGVVTRRNVNPGNNVTVGQSLMAVRSITEIWIDANFKETQLADLRIGQPV
jgi:membrane fusion protein (multidrug efflux system)